MLRATWKNAEDIIFYGGFTEHKTCNQMKPEIFKALQILKSCYKDGLNKVEDEIMAHEHNPLLPIDDSD